MGRVSWKWLAGFFDGEGCLYVQKLNKSKRAFHVRFHIYQNDESVLLMVRDFLRAHEIESQVKPSGNSCFQLTISKREDVMAVLVNLIPNLIVKRTRAMECHTYLVRLTEAQKKHGLQYWRYTDEITPPAMNRKAA